MLISAIGGVICLPVVPSAWKFVLLLPSVLASVVTYRIDKRYAGGAIIMAVVIASVGGTIVFASGVPAVISLCGAVVTTLSFTVVAWMQRVGFGRTMRIAVPVVLAALSLLPVPIAALAAFGVTGVLCCIREFTSGTHEG